MRGITIIFEDTLGRTNHSYYVAPTLSQCFRRFFAERPVDYAELIGWEVEK